MIEIKNLGEVADTIDNWLADCEKLTTNVAKCVAIKIFDDVVYRSVQYSGDFAANWKFQVGGITPSYGVNIFKNEAVYTFGRVESGTSGDFKAKVNTEVYGDTSKAPRYAVSKNVGNESSFKLGDTIYLHNSSTHDEPYAVGIEEGKIKLRSNASVAPLMKARVNVMRSDRLTLIDATNLKHFSGITQLDSLRRRKEYK